MNKDNKKTYDVVVIGGGPAGMMAAITAGANGAETLLIEKNSRLGVKLLMTGGGRCNITNLQDNNLEFSQNFNKASGFVTSLLSQLNTQQTVDFFEEGKLRTKVERGRRVFPKSDSALSVLKALTILLRKYNVAIATGIEVHRLSFKDNKLKKIVLKNKKIVYAKSAIIATGGLSYPSSGSTGDGLRWAKCAEHTVVTPTPSLTSMVSKDAWIKNTQGLSLKNIEITFCGKKKIKRFGELLFTHFGISGPVVLDASREIGDWLKEGPVTVFIDMKPGLTTEKLDSRIVRDFLLYQKKMLKNALDDLLPNKIISTVISLSSINPNKKVGDITKEERRLLISIIKKLPLAVTALSGFHTAIITKGGVSLSEIDQKTMSSKKISNLFFAGEVIDADGPTGGYNLQLCWSSGYVAGKNAANNK